MPAVCASGGWRVGEAVWVAMISGREEQRGEGGGRLVCGRGMLGPNKQS